MTTHARKRIKRIIRIATWNVTSWGNRDQEIIIEISKHQIDICSVTETRKKGKGSIMVGKYMFFYSGTEKSERANAGVGLLIDNKYINNITDVHYINERILMVTLSLENRAVHIISVYAPQTGRPKPERDIFYQNLQDLLDDIPGKHPAIIMGDFNGHIGNTVIPGVKQKFNSPEENESGEELIGFCTLNEMRITNTYFDHKPQHKYTWTDNRGRKSTIDFILTNKNIHPTQIHDVRTLTSANVGTDHGLVLGKLNLALRIKRTNGNLTIEKINNEKLEDPSTQYLFQSRLEQKFKEKSPTENQETNEMWDIIASNILSAAKEALGTRKSKERPNPTRTPWFSEEIREMANAKKKAFLKYKNNPNATEYEQYKRTRNTINQEIRKQKEEYWERYTKDIEHDLYGAQKRIWRMLQKQKKPVNEYIHINHISKEQWTIYFRNQFEQTKNQIKNKTDNVRYTGVKISLEKIIENVNKLKNRKTAGPDAITNEMIKYGGPILVEQLHLLLNKILETSEIPTPWKESITIPIHKKGDRKTMDNYRGITLLNSTLKLLTSVIRDDLQETIEMAEEQQGFRKNRGTIDAIFIVRQIIEKSIEYDHPAFLCFIDLTKAFDRVRKQDILDILNEKEVATEIMNVIKDMYTNNITRVRTSEGMTEDIKMNEGIRQGDSLSPFLFNLIMEKIIEAIKPLPGYRMGTHNVNIICYADDAVLIANNEDDLQRMVHRFNLTAKKYNMQISTQKTKCMVISKEPRRCKLQIENSVIEQVMHFKYLGSEITSYRDTLQEMNTQNTKATQVAGCLRDCIWRNKYMRTDAKTKVYKAMVRPVLTYGTETRAETKRTKQKIRVTEMKVMRAILKVNLRERQTNSSIRERCGIQDVVKWSKIRKKKWKEHVERMTEERLPSICMNGRPTGKRPPGRPPMRWAQSWFSSSTE